MLRSVCSWSGRLRAPVRSAVGGGGSGLGGGGGGASGGAGTSDVGSTNVAVKTLPSSAVALSP